MKLIVWGIILLFFAIFSIIGYYFSSEVFYLEKQRPIFLIEIFLSYVIAGILLIYFGKKSVKKNKRILEVSSQMLEEFGFIDSIKIAKQLGTSEIKIREVLFYGKRKGLIPFKAEIK